jgi:glycosyltransferase involved in cell wall biosynthesis
MERLTVYPPNPRWRNGKRHLLVYLGEICKQDGVGHLVRAVKLLRDELDRDDVHCVLVGGGPHQPSIKAYAEELGVDDLCTFTGRVSDDDLCRILSSADLGVDPDPKNPWSDKSTMNKIMEYLFFGLPMVGYDLTENRVSAGQAALIATQTTRPTWPAASSNCWTTRTAARRWAASARSVCARCWPGSTRPRCCWPPTTGTGPTASRG